MSDEENNVELIKAMGFHDENEIRAALKKCKNDVNEAVFLLTSDSNYSNYSKSENEFGPGRSPHSYRQNESSFSYSPPSYDETLQLVDFDPEDPNRFPIHYLIELEKRVFTENWSIPYKKEESLGVCLKSSIHLIENSIDDSSCAQFLESVLPDCFKKLLTSPNVYRWKQEIQEGIYNMLQLLIDVCAAQLRHKVIHEKVLESVRLAFHSETEFFDKNRRHAWDSSVWTERLGAPQVVARPLLGKEPFGWLVNLMNRFAWRGGFQSIADLISTQELSFQKLCHLLAPIASCSMFLVAGAVKSTLGPVLESVFARISELTDEQLKDKSVSEAFELLDYLKRIWRELFPDEASKVDSFRLKLLLKMLQLTNFNSKMNALKELSRLMEMNVSIPKDVFVQWLLDHKIVSLALAGNLDQSQYCEKIHSIVEFMKVQIRADELEAIWRTQDKLTSTALENFHSLAASAAVYFSAEELNHLLELIERSIVTDGDVMRDKFIALLGKIGRESKGCSTAEKVLALLWKLAQHEQLLHDLKLVELLLAEQRHVVIQTGLIRESVLKAYLINCLEMIQKNELLLIFFNHFHQLCQLLIQSQFYHKQDKRFLNEFIHHYDLIQLLTHCLVTYHRQAAAWCSASEQPLSGAATMAEHHYCHSEVVSSLLEFLQFLLKEGNCYLTIEKVREVWAVLITNEDACEWDREKAFDWFCSCSNDLEPETKTALFHREVLQLAPATLSMKGMYCFETFFQSVNTHEGKLAEFGHRLSVVRADLAGMNFLWDVVTYNHHEELARHASCILISLSYTMLGPKLRREPELAHGKFIGRCYEKLLCALAGGGASPTGAAKSMLVTSATAGGDTSAEMASVIGRLLRLIVEYIVQVERGLQIERTIPPHGASFQSYPITLMFTADAWTLWLQTHVNESLSVIRRWLAGQLSMASSRDIELYLGEKAIPVSAMHKTLAAMSVQYSTAIGVKIVSSYPRGSDSSDFIEPETERHLPSVVAARGQQGMQLFDLLYNLGDCECADVVRQVRELLNLMPTDPRVIEKLDGLASKPSRHPSIDDLLGEKKGAKQRSDEQRLSSPLSHREILSSLFHVDQVSPFRLLYHLEVLASRLMPVSHDVTGRQSATSFMSDFFAAGGIPLLLSLLQVDKEMDLELRRSVVLTTIQLLRFLLVEELIYASPDKGNVHFISSKETGLFLGGDYLQTGLSEQEALQTVTSLLKVSWAAAAGRLWLSASSSPIKARWQLTDGQLSMRTSSTESSGSNEEGLSLRAGICARAAAVDPQDVQISQHSLELLTHLLTYRHSLFDQFLLLAEVPDFIVDTLVKSREANLRHYAMEQFWSLSKMADKPSLRHMLLRVLFGARLPFWVPSASSRNLPVLLQSQQYFELVCRLLQRYSRADQEQVGLDPRQQLKDEVNWLKNFSRSSLKEVKVADELLLEGHMKLIAGLLAAEAVRKSEFTAQLIDYLLEQVLFPASHVVLSGAPIADTGVLDLNEATRVAGYSLLLEICRGEVDNLRKVATRLVELHHARELDEWDYFPLVEPRSANGLVGLKNGGATCYMNSVIQQLFMRPGVVQALAEVDTLNSGLAKPEGLLYQFQVVLAHLGGSLLQYFVPGEFWKQFRLWGEEVNIREQQDAFDFFTSLTDQLDEALKSIHQGPLFQLRLHGLFSAVFDDGQHSFEREERFNAINLTVQSGQLETALDEFFKLERLEGANAYYCDSCGAKRNAVKRTSIKKLPETMCIQLKRFAFDWEAGRPIKFDNFFKFPRRIDMGPYCGGRRRADDDLSLSGSGSSAGSCVYDLAGIVVHSGQASAGHYYSFIKERRETAQTNANYGKWFKFDDRTVEEVNMTDDMLESECFGGSFKSDKAEERRRYWNAYLLFYERTDVQQMNMAVPLSAMRLRRSTKRTTSGLKSSSRVSRDSFSELAQLVEQQEVVKVMTGGTWARIQQQIREENLCFLRDKDVYSQQYFVFVRRLAELCKEEDEHFPAFAVESLQLGLSFLFRTFWRTTKKLRSDMSDWLGLFTFILKKSESACVWFLNYMTENAKPARMTLLECPVAEVRQALAAMLVVAIRQYAFYRHDGCRELSPFLRVLLEFFGDHLETWAKQSSQFFSVLQSLTTMGGDVCQLLLQMGFFEQLLNFLLLENKWTTTHRSQFAPLHECIAAMISSLANAGHELTDVMKDVLFGRRQTAYLKQVLISCRETPVIAPRMSGMFKLLCEDNPSFSETLLALLLTQTQTVLSNEIRELLLILSDLMTMNDRYQAERIAFTLDGRTTGDESLSGLLKIIELNQEKDARRSYQCIKFLVQLANKADPVRHYLLQNPTALLWCVDWLKSKMNENACPMNDNSSNEDSNTRHFQRTMSAQVTLEEATALVSHIRQPSDDEMKE